MTIIDLKNKIKAIFEKIEDNPKLFVQVGSWYNGASEKSDAVEYRVMYYPASERGKAFVEYANHGDFLTSHSVETLIDTLTSAIESFLNIIEKRLAGIPEETVQI